MKKYLFLLLLAGITTINLYAQSPAWQNVKVVQENRQPSRTTFMSYDRGEDVVTLDFSKSTFYVPLNGKWAFRLASGQADADQRFYSSSYRGEQTEVEVPGYFAPTSADELANLKAPELPAKNLIGQYRAQIEIPIFWLDRDIFFRAEGVKGGLTLYVNGVRVGYSEESGTPAEFNISPYVTDGVNTVAMEVSQWSTAAWLENATLNGAGIEGDVYVYSQYKIHINDFTVEATLDSLNKTGVLNLAVEVVNNFNKADSIVVYYDLRDEKGKPVRYNTRETIVPGQGGRDTVYFTGKIADVKQWTPEAPNRYQLILRVRYQGRFTEYVPYMVGFHKVEKEDNKYYLNGNPLKFRWQNGSYSGIAPDDKTMREELLKMKKNNVNAIECYYHPRKSRLYDLCGEVGLIVHDQVNIDTRLTGENLSVGGTLSNNPEWIEAYLIRQENTWRLNRNQTPVLMYSIGNGPGLGYNIYKSYLYFKANEQRRPVFYEPAGDVWCTD